LSAYDGINGTRANKVNFNLNHEGRPIYKKVFSPSDSTTVVDLSTGVFTINEHFFNTGEELIYTPDQHLLELVRVQWELELPKIILVL
jgi:hypothetical protein